MWWLKQLLSPLNYLRIVVGRGALNSKKFYDFVLPTVLSVASMVLLINLPKAPLIFTSSGLLDTMQSLVTQLMAFFVAALAAVATFNHPPLNSQMDGEPAVLWRKEPGVDEPQPNKLTRRQYICYLFGYLAFSAFFVFIYITVGKIVAQSIKDMVSQEVGSLLKWSYVGLLVWVFWNMAISFLLSLFFLTERIHRQ